MVYSVYKRINKKIKMLQNRNEVQIYKSIKLVLILIYFSYLARVYMLEEFYIFLAISNALAYSKFIKKDTSK